MRAKVDAVRLISSVSTSGAAPLPPFLTSVLLPELGSCVRHNLMSSSGCEQRGQYRPMPMRNTSLYFQSCAYHQGIGQKFRCCDT